MRKCTALFNPAMIEALFPGQQRHFSFTNYLFLKLTDGMPLANVSSSLKIAKFVRIDVSNYDYHMESFFNFLLGCKHDGILDGRGRLASIDGVRGIEFVQVFICLFFKHIKCIRKSLLIFK
jgi:hypothetical protein